MKFETVFPSAWMPFVLQEHPVLVLLTNQDANVFQDTKDSEIKQMEVVLPISVMPTVIVERMKSVASAILDNSTAFPSVMSLFTVERMLFVDRITENQYAHVLQSLKEILKYLVKGLT